MHAEFPQENCPSCPATFLSVEELEVHQSKHEQHPLRPFTCFICNKRYITFGATHLFKTTLYSTEIISIFGIKSRQKNGAIKRSFILSSRWKMIGDDDEQVANVSPIFEV